MKKNNFVFKFIFFLFFIFFIFLRSTFAIEINKQIFKQGIVSYLLQLDNPIYWIIYIIIFIVFFYFLFQALSSTSPFSNHVSFIIALGLTMILSITRVIGIISNFLYDIINFYKEQWLHDPLYTIMFYIAPVLIVLLVIIYVLRWIFYTLRKKKEESEEFEKKEERKATEKALEEIGKAIK